MIRTTAALLRHAQDFFRTELVGLYSFDKDVRIDAPERRDAIPSAVDRRTRREMMESREGLGKWLEKERLQFGPWEILIYSAQEKPPVGEVALRREGETMVAGPLDPSTWAKIGEWIRQSHQRKAS